MGIVGKKVFDIKIRYPKDAAFQPRCNISNDTDIELVCHHCGIPLAPSSKDFVKGFFRKNFFYKKKLLHLIKKANSEPKTTLIWQLKGFLNVFKNREFSGLDIHPDQAVHCKKCKHHHPSQTLNAIIITVVLLTFLVDQGMFVGVTGTLKLLIILFGFTLIIVNWRFFRKRDVRKFPILGRMPEIQVNEWINGSINLMKDGNYAAKIFGKGLGEIKFSTKITSNDERRLNDFKKTTSYKPIQRTYQQIAGFLLFQIARKINWIGNLSLTPKHVNKVLLKKPASFSNHLESFEFINKYNFELTPKEQFSLPIQIIPVILSEGKPCQ